MIQPREIAMREVVGPHPEEPNIVIAEEGCTGDQFGCGLEITLANSSVGSINDLHSSFGQAESKLGVFAGGGKALVVTADGQQ
jgi:hypothetical protein